MLVVWVAVPKLDQADPAVLSVRNAPVSKFNEYEAPCAMPVVGIEKLDGVPLNPDGLSESTFVVVTVRPYPEVKPAAVTSAIVTVRSHE